MKRKLEKNVEWASLFDRIQHDTTVVKKRSQDAQREEAKTARSKTEAGE
jgi:hypothetical protein